MISGWRLTDGVEFTFAEGTRVPDRGYAVIARIRGTLCCDGGDGAVVPYGRGLSNSGEQLALSDRNYREMDVLIRRWR